MAEDKDIAGMVKLPVAWIGVEELPVLAANQVVSQFQGDLFILSLGVIAPPMLLGSHEDMMEQAKRLSFVPVKPVARIAATREFMVQLIDVLTRNLANYDESKGRGAKG